MYSINKINEDSANEKVNLSLAVLKKLYNYYGNCFLNGYIGDSIVDFTIDENGYLEFITNKVTDDKEISSTGTVLTDSVIIKQIESSSDRINNQLFSWDIYSNKYTYISFDNEESMNECFNKIKSNDINLCRGDVSLSLKNIGISFDNVSQILLCKDYNSISSMFDTDTIDKSKKVK